MTRVLRVPACAPGGRQRVAAERQPVLRLVTDRLEAKVAERA